MRAKESPSSNSNRRGGLRALVEPRCLSPLALDDIGDGGPIAIRRSSYLKLPPQTLIKLSVIKLDGSLFDVHIARSDTVAELKRAVEQVFTSSPKEGQGRISWSHVWGHFCLCYQGRKLINDKACISKFGIKDGDQLHFIRHLTINHSPLNRRSKSQTCKRYLEFQSEPNVPEEKEQNLPQDNEKNQMRENNISKICPSEAQDELPPIAEFKLANFLRGWLSYSKLWGVSRRETQGRSRPSRFALQCLGSRPKIIQL